MPIVRVVTSTDLGKGLLENQETKKVDINVDGTTVQFNAQGQLTATAPVDVKVSNAEIVDDTTLRITLSDANTFDVSLAKFLNVDTDTKPTAVAIVGDNIEITLSDGTKVSGSLADFKASLHHTELQDLAGNALGNTVK